MNKKRIEFSCIHLLLPLLLLGCQPSVPITSNRTEYQMGTLQFRVNGEDFVRQGLMSKDGWKVTFEQVYVHLTEAKAYQTNSPYNAKANSRLQGTQMVELVTLKTVDLAQGDENADTILVSEVSVPGGQYNALSWKMTPAPSGPAAGQVIIIQGSASKDNQTIPFTVKINQPLEFTCGDYVGETRKGILQPGETTDVEATFHFDHLFGDGEAEPTDEINTEALGFEPIATLAENGIVEADWQTLTTQLSPEDVEKLKKILPSLGHVGEGHCTELQLESPSD